MIVSWGVSRERGTRKMATRKEVKKCFRVRHRETADWSEDLLALFWLRWSWFSFSVSLIECKSLPKEETRGQLYCAMTKAYFKLEERKRGHFLRLNQYCIFLSFYFRAVIILVHYHYCHSSLGVCYYFLLWGNHNHCALCEPDSLYTLKNRLFCSRELKSRLQQHLLLYCHPNLILIFYPLLSLSSPFFLFSI